MSLYEILELNTNCSKVDQSEAYTEQSEAGRSSEARHIPNKVRLAGGG
jgi:hypothetical protein